MRYVNILILISGIVGAKSYRIDEEPFPVYWNVPSENCVRHGIKIPLSNFSIRHNENQRFFGSEVVIFYEDKFGAFPYFINENASQPVNGGLPQLCKIGDHLAAARSDIELRIPDGAFSGVAVIDFEAWRPLFHLNWGAKRIYQRESMRIVREREPTLSEKAVKRRALNEFNTAARKIFLHTMRLARAMRPYAKWGFYGFPYCNYDVGERGEAVCTDNFQQYNDELAFITKSGTALFPSIYLNSASSKKNFRYVQAILSESRRIAENSTPNLPIFPYTKFEYNPYEEERQKDFYEKRDLCNSIKQSADFGASGMVLWSTSYKMQKERCRAIAHFVEKNLGPTVRVVRKRATKCSHRLCSGHGTCVLKQPSNRCQFRINLDDYHCKCDVHYAGRHCTRNGKYLSVGKHGLKITDWKDGGNELYT